MKLKIIKILLPILLILSLTSCKGFFKYSPARENPVKGPERAKKNIEEGRGMSLGNLRKGGKTTYEFSTSNPMWRASLEILDFLPLTTVDYSGGMIITDWYYENSSDEAIKITIRFLANEIASENLKVIVHKKTCSGGINCKISLLKQNKIKDELLTSIIRTAARLELESKRKKK